MREVAGGVWEACRRMTLGPGVALDGTLDLRASEAVVFGEGVVIRGGSEVTVGIGPAQVAASPGG